MTNKRTTGRTWVDLIADNRKIALIIGLLFIVLILIGFIFGNLSLKIGALEINKKQTHSDTVYLSRTDTIIIEKPTIVSKMPKQENKIQVKKGDTTIVATNQPANINVGGTQNVVNENKGIIGNNNQININAENQRHLDKENQIRLIQLVDNTIAQLKKNDKYCMRVSALMGNGESLNLAQEILQFLKSNKYNVNGIGQFMRSPEIKGVAIGISRRDSCIEINVGYK